MNVQQFISECPGWCSEHKANTFIELIKNRNIKLTVEIGVYGGRSLFTQALAHKLYTGGIAYGIDPWTVEAALQVGCEDLDNFTKSINFEELYQQTAQKIIKYGLENHCKLIRLEAEKAINSVPDEIELLHIDGNHGTQAVISDVINYMPKVKSGGLIWFDDVGWHTVKPAIEVAKSNCKLFKQVDGNNLILEKI